MLWVVQFILTKDAASCLSQPATQQLLLPNSPDYPMPPSRLPKKTAMLTLPSLPTLSTALLAKL
jgi:hypothetical protein